VVGLDPHGRSFRPSGRRSVRVADAPSGRAETAFRDPRRSSSSMDPRTHTGGPGSKSLFEDPCRPAPSVCVATRIPPGGRRREQMWTDRHRTRHETRLKNMVMQAGLERGSPFPGAGGPADLAERQISAPRHSSRYLASAHGRWMAGAARRLPALAHRLRLVSALGGEGAVRDPDASYRAASASPLRNF